MKKSMMIGLCVCVVGVMGCGWIGKRGEGKEAVRYQTVVVGEGSVVATVGATGTIEPEELIDIGSQVSGKILSFGEGLDGEPLDYCSVVTNGMVLARIDDVTYVADLDVAQAKRSRAEAEVAVAEANVAEARVRFRKAERDWARVQRLGVGDVISQSSYDGYEAEYEAAEVAVKVREANVLQAKAGVVEAEASVEKAERNLSYCTICSPVDGVVIDRRVNVGQTVVSSMNVSSLFLVARDLRKVQIWVAVNEADIGSIQAGTPVVFTVDTLPGREFQGVVKRIRLNATVTSNVVTYTVEVETPNEDGALLPFLTANVAFETARADGALVVPSKALRFRPAGVAPGGGSAVYVMGTDGTVRREAVEVLLNNGSEAAIRGAGVKAGDRVVTAALAMAPGGAKGEEEGSKNPFLPSMPKPPKKGHMGPP